MRDGDLEIQFLVQFIAADALEVVVTLVKELLFEKGLGVVQCGRIAGAHLFEEFDQGGFGNGLAAGQIPLRLLVERGREEHAFGIVIHILEQRDDLFV